MTNRQHARYERNYKKAKAMVREAVKLLVKARRIMENNNHMFAPIGGSACDLNEPLKALRHPAWRL